MLLFCMKVISCMTLDNWIPFLCMKLVWCEDMWYLDDWMPFLCMMLVSCMTLDNWIPFICMKLVSCITFDDWMPFYAWRSSHVRPLDDWMSLFMHEGSLMYNRKTTGYQFYAWNFSTKPFAVKDSFHLLDARSYQLHCWIFTFLLPQKDGQTVSLILSDIVCLIVSQVIYFQSK